MTWPITRHNPTWRDKIPKEDTKLERPFRRILERLARWTRMISTLHQSALPLSFHSQEGCDFTMDSEIAWHIDGPHHAKSRQQEKDVWVRGKLLLERGLKSWAFDEIEMLHCQQEVQDVVLAHHRLIEARQAYLRRR